MRIAKKEGTVKLNGSSPEFAGTVFAGHDFEIEVKQINRVEKARIRRKFAKAGKKGKLSEDAAGYGLFKDVVVSWKGFENEEGKKLPCDDTGKQFLFENCPDLADVVIVAATASRIQGEDESSEDEEGKNS